MFENINVDEIVAHMAVKHQLIISRNDPVILLMLFNEEIQKKNIERINNEFSQYQESLNNIYKIQEIHALESVNKVINECNAIAKKTLEDSAKNAALVLKNEIQNQLKILHLKNEQYSDEIKKSKRIALFSAAIALTSMLITVIVLFI